MATIKGLRDKLKRNLGVILVGTAFTAMAAFGTVYALNRSIVWTESPTERITAEVVSKRYIPSSGIFMRFPEMFEIKYHTKYGDFYENTPEAFQDQRKEVPVDTKVKTYETYSFGRKDGGHGGGRQFGIVNPQ